MQNLYICRRGWGARGSGGSDVSACSIYYFCICYIGERSAGVQSICFISFGLKLQLVWPFLCLWVHEGPPLFFKWPRTQRARGAVAPQTSSVHRRAHASPSSPGCRAHSARPHLLSSAKHESFRCCRLAAFPPRVSAVFFSRARCERCLCFVELSALSVTRGAPARHMRTGPRCWTTRLARRGSGHAPTPRPKVLLCDVHSVCVLCWLFRPSNV